MSTLKSRINEHISVISQIEFLSEDIDKVVDACVASVKLDGKLMFCGNGGSAADSQHIAAEFTGRFLRDRVPLPGLSLTTDTSALTCISNDYSFEDVFSRQVLALGRKDDCLICYSTSGNSKNIIKAVRSAKNIGLKTILFSGADGGALRDECDLNILVNSKVTARIQEAHIFISHFICEQVEKKLGFL